MPNSDFYIERLRRESLYTMSHFHEHNSYEIYYLHSGERQYFIQDTTYAVRSGDIVLINRHDLHKTIAPGTNIHERTLINFKKSFIAPLIGGGDTPLFEAFGANRHVYSLSSKQKQTAEHMLHTMLMEYTSQRGQYRLYLQSLLIQFLIFIHRMAKEMPFGHAEHSIAHNRKAAEIVRYLQHRFHEPFSLAELAGNFHISRYHLCRSFKQYTGFTPVEYVQQLRVKAAEQLLVETNRQVQHIANQVGFNSMIHFNRVFKHMTGMTPTSFRKARSI